MQSILTQLSSKHLRAYARPDLNSIGRMREAQAQYFAVHALISNVLPLFPSYIMIFSSPCNVCPALQAHSASDGSPFGIGEQQLLRRPDHISEQSAANQLFHVFQILYFFLSSFASSMKAHLHLSIRLIPPHRYTQRFYTYGCRHFAAVSGWFPCASTEAWYVPKWAHEHLLDFLATVLVR